jgi:hypothetical protein
MSDANFDADLDRDNFEKLCGKTGELVEFRRKQMLIGAAQLLKNNCRENDCGDCLFWQIRGYGGCQLQFTAKDWDMPEVTS